MFFSEIRVGADYMEVERSLKMELFFVGLHANILVQSWRTRFMIIRQGHISFRSTSVG